MARLGVHPRLAHMLLRARPLGLSVPAVALAALLSEGERGTTAQGRGARAEVDLRVRLEMLFGAQASAPAPTLQRLRRTRALLERQLAAERVAGPASAPHAGGTLRPEDIDRAGLLLALAYPDRIALRRAGAEGRYLLENGRGAFFAEAHSLARAELIVAAELEEREREARILLAAPVSRADLESQFESQLSRERTVAWDAREQAVIARERVCLGALVLEERPLASVAREETTAAMLEGVRALGLDALPWSREARELQARIEFVRALQAHEVRAQWPAADDASLLHSLGQWLGPWLEGVSRREQLARVPLLEALRARLTYPQQRALDELAPQTFTVPSGSRVRIDYLDESAPVLEVRLQEVFGLAQTPRLGGGRVPITFKLLSPARRPVQITRDLASFWRRGYAEVRRDLRGRYPRHYWPEDPLQAQPTRGVRPRG